MATTALYRQGFAHQSYSNVEQQHKHYIRARLLTSLTIWICVLMIIDYGYSGNTQLVLGPNSSRLLKSNSIFVEKILAKDETEHGLVLYGFSDKPKLSLQFNWNLSDHIVLIETSRRKGFSLWLNKGSRILVTWTAHMNDIKDLSLTVIKGESNFVTLQPSNSPAFPVLKNLTYGNIQADEYLINEDDTYYISVENKNPRGISMTMNVDVSSTMYDTTKANSKCPMVNGLCQLDLLFPSTQYVLLTTPNNGNINVSVIELYFVARLIIYVTIFVIIVVIIMLIFKYLGGYDEPRTPEEATRTEADPLAPGRPSHFTYGTNEEDPDLDSCGSVEDLYEGKICAICYDEQRNCFFVPCGHCATCYECAQRIMDADNKVCPICRRYIHKVRRLFSP